MNPVKTAISLFTLVFTGFALSAPDTRPCALLFASGNSEQRLFEQVTRYDFGVSDARVTQILLLNPESPLRRELTKAADAGIASRYDIEDFLSKFQALALPLGDAKEVLLRQTVLKKGLESHFFSEKKGVFNTLRLKTRTAFQKLFRSKILAVLRLPWQVPLFKPNEIPDELLEKILWEGAEANQWELERIARIASQKNRYHRFARFYNKLGAILFAVIAPFAVYEHMRHRIAEIDAEIDARHLIEDQRILEEARAESFSHLDEVIKEYLVKEFKTQSGGREPSPEEVNELFSKLDTA